MSDVKFLEFEEHFLNFKRIGKGIESINDWRASKYVKWGRPSTIFEKRIDASVVEWGGKRRRRRRISENHVVDIGKK